MDTNTPNEQQVNQQFNQQFGQSQNSGMQQDVPNATASLVLGICSLVFCGLGPILGTIALVLSGNGKKAYALNPSMYKESSLKNLNAGRTCGTIGLIIGSLIWLFYITIFIIAIVAGTGF